MPETDCGALGDSSMLTNIVVVPPAVHTPQLHVTPLLVALASAIGDFVLKVSIGVVGTTVVAPLQVAFPLLVVTAPAHSDTAISSAPEVINAEFPD